MARRLIVEIIGDSRSLERSFQRSSRATQNFDRNVSRATRGALAGSGAFRAMGRSIAFASGGFLAFASAGQFLRKSIDAARDAQVTQRQLAAQFRASGQDLRQYQRQIERTINRVSLLAGFQNDQLKAAFTTIFRTTGDVSKSLRDLSTAADLARAKHLDLNQAALILAKTEAGNTTLLRRQGFQIDKNASSEKALAQVRAAVRGQARAGTTAEERFGAALHNTEEIVGRALLPTLTKYLNAGARWLTQMNESGKLQQDAAIGARNVGSAFTFAAAAIDKAADAFKQYREIVSKAPGGKKGFLQTLLGGTVVDQLKNFVSQAKNIRNASPGLLELLGIIGGGGGGGAKVRDFIKGGAQLFQPNLFGTPVIDTSGFGRQFFKRGPAVVPGVNIPGTVSGTALLQRPQPLLRSGRTSFAQVLPQVVRGAFQFLRDSFTVPLRLQLEEARAAAQGRDLTPILLRVRAAALKAIKSGKLAAQAQIEAWNQIAQINDQLKQQTQGDQTKFRHVNVRAILRGLGLTGDALRRASQQLAQIGAGGTAPASRSQAFALSHGAVVIHGGVHLHGVQNLNQLEDQLEKRARSRPQVRRGAR